MVKALRVDERLIHGQVAMAWTRELGIQGIMVADDEAAGNEMPLVWITAILEKYKGDTPVYIYEEKTKRKMKADRKFWVTLEEGLLEELRKLLGEKNVAVKNG